MSATVDTNILVYASNVDAPEHSACGDLLARLVAGPELVTLFWPVLYGYIRIATHPRIFASPLTAVEAEAGIDALLAGTAVRVVGEDDSSWSAYKAGRLGTRPRGNLVPDAVIVAMMTTHGVRTIYTKDRYFRQFDGIDVIDPTA